MWIEGKEPSIHCKKKKPQVQKHKKRKGPQMMIPTLCYFNAEKVPTEDRGPFLFLKSVLFFFVPL